MIKRNIRNRFNNQYNTLSKYSSNIYVADYTEATKNQPIKRGVEIFCPNPPADINYFSITNPKKITTIGIIFDNNSFVYSDGSSKSQCESVFFPDNSNNKSWILFCELKYSNKTHNNRRNLQKAIKQLYKTRYYYFQESIFGEENICYLIASLPLQTEPFLNFSLSPAYLRKLKRKRNIVLRLSNNVEILSDEIIIT